jgi:hypothetical protein
MIGLNQSWPNNSPEPTPIELSVPLSRLTDLAARLSFCRWENSKHLVKTCYGKA